MNELIAVLDSLDWIGSGVFGLVGAFGGSWLQRRMQKEDAARAAATRKADLEMAAVQRARDAWKAATVDDVRDRRWEIAERLRDLADEIPDTFTREAAYAAADRLETHRAAYPSGVEGQILYWSKRTAMAVLGARLRGDEVDEDSHATVQAFIDEANGWREDYDEQHGA